MSKENIGTKTLKREIIFHDTENNKVTLEIELKDGRFSMSGSMGGSCGQILDDIKVTPNQGKLIDIWRGYHLNDMHAGTPEQEELLKQCSSHGYENQVSFLKEHGLYTVILEDGSSYDYGTKWLSRILPVDLWGQVNDICEDILADEILRKKVYEENMGSWVDLDIKIQALGKFLGMTPDEAKENITELRQDSVFMAEGIDYFVGDDSETEDYCKEYLTDDTELYSMWVQDQIKQGNASNILNINDWAGWVIRSDGYGSILNSWDGSEDYSSEYEMYIIRV